MSGSYSREILVDDGACELARPVGPEVEEDDSIAVAHAAPAERHRLDELIGDALRIGALDGLHRVDILRIEPAYHRVVGALHPVPSAVAVHGVIAALDARYADVARAVAIEQELVDLALELAHVTRSALGRHIAPVEEAMHVHLRHTGSGRSREQRVQMRVRGMHAAIAQKAHQVHRSAVVARRAERMLDDRIRRQRAVFARAVDAGELLVDDAPGPDVQVPHLGVAHLPGGKPHRVARRFEPDPRALSEEAVEHRGVSLGDGVALPFRR